MYQDAVKVPIGDWATKRFKSMGQNDFVRHISKKNDHLGRNVSNWLNKKKVFPHNVLVFEEEHRLYLSNVVEAAVDNSNKNHSAIFSYRTSFCGLRPSPLAKKGRFSNRSLSWAPVLLWVAALLHQRNYLGTELKSEYVEEAKANINEIEAEVLNSQ